jgi:hypothetical protein
VSSRTTSSPSAVSPTATSWHTYDTGGHYVAHQATDILVADLTAFFAPLR